MDEYYEPKIRVPHLRSASKYDRKGKLKSKYPRKQLYKYHRYAGLNSAYESDDVNIDLIYYFDYIDANGKLVKKKNHPYDIDHIDSIDDIEMGIKNNIEYDDNYQYCNDYGMMIDDSNKQPIGCFITEYFNDLAPHIIVCVISYLLKKCKIEW